MALLKRKQPGNILFLQAVRYENEKLPRGKVRMLYVDARGNVFASLMKRSVYDAACKCAAGSGARRGPFATIGINAGPGKYLPATVAISHEQAWALERMLEHMLTIGKLPDVLKKYIEPIINYGADAHKTLSAPPSNGSKRPGTATPDVLERLPYYPDGSTEVSIPLYKARYKPPLVVLNRLNPDNKTPAGMQRILILDNDGDMAVIMVPTMIFRKLELELIEGTKQDARPTRAILEPDGNTFKASYLPITREQQRSLEVLTRHWEQTGSIRQPVSMAVQTVLTRARG